MDFSPTSEAVLTPEKAKKFVETRAKKVSELVANNEAVFFLDQGDLPFGAPDVRWGLGYLPNPDADKDGVKGLVFDILIKKQDPSQTYSESDIAKAAKKGIVLGNGGWGSASPCMDGLLSRVLDQASHSGFGGIAVSSSPIASEGTLLDAQKFNDISLANKQVDSLAGFLKSKTDGEIRLRLDHSMMAHGLARKWQEVALGESDADPNLYQNTKFIAIAGVPEGGDPVTLTKDKLLKLILAVDKKRWLMSIDDKVLGGIITRSTLKKYLSGSADEEYIVESHYYTLTKFPGLAECQTRILDQMGQMFQERLEEAKAKARNFLLLICMAKDKVLATHDQINTAANAVDIGTEHIDAMIYPSGHYWNEETADNIAIQSAAMLASGQME